MLAGAKMSRTGSGKKEPSHDVAPLFHHEDDRIKTTCSRASYHTFWSGWLKG
jgi:hypothetical protein